MTTVTHIPPDEDPIGVAVAEYLQARERACPIPLSELEKRYPIIATELRGFVDDSDGIATSLQAFRGQFAEPSLQTEERFLGDYELLEKVGGNMGIVYRARQRSLPREVAVKVLLRSGNLDRERFRREAEAMARLHHPHIVSIFEVSRGERVPYFSMEWSSGGTLANQISEFKHEPMRAAELMEQIARAIHHAHQRGLLHRDLKPANILFDDSGSPRVADFGLAMNLAGIDESAGLCAGTPAYMAPEQLTGEVTIVTDVFGIGAVLYELLTGQPPFSGSAGAQILDQVRLSQPVSPRKRNTRIAPDLEAICLKCLSKNPADRYASALGVAADLERFQNGQPIEARPLGLLGRVRHLLQQVKSGNELQALGPGLLGQSMFVLLSNATVFGLLQAGAREAWIWMAIFSSYVPLFAILIRDRWTDGARYNAARQHLWSIWAGHAATCAALFIALRVPAGSDFVHGIETGYVGCAGLNALAFTIMGSLFVGRQYLLGMSWAIAAVFMGAFLAYAPLIYAFLMAICSLLTGLQLKAMSQSGVDITST
jgi:serine/threonine-protein kinase